MFKRECTVLGIIASVLFAIFYGVPLIQMFIGSFLSNAELGASGHFSGARNYVLAWRDPAYGQAFLASTAFTLSAVFLQIVLAFGAALLTRQSFRFVGILRWILIIPYFLPSVVVVVAWKFFSDPFVGILPKMAGWIGLAIPDLRGAESALPAMIIVATYEAFPFTYVVLLARMMQIPDSLYEVTELYGANPVEKFLTVTWPQVRLAVLSLTLLRILITWLKFDVPWLVYAGNAPSPWGDTLGVAIYRTAFQNLRQGKAYAASVSILCVLLTLFITWYVLVQVRRRIGFRDPSSPRTELIELIR